VSHLIPEDVETMTRDHQTRKVSSIKQQSLGLSQAKQRMEQIIQQQGGLTHQ
jgi:hypothetical protein